MSAAHRPGRLCIIIDWSEVFAFITMASPPESDELAHVLGEDGADLCRTAHHTAMTVLFERVAGSVQLILLPPHLDECIHFVRLVRGSALTDSVLREATKRLLSGAA